VHENTVLVRLVQECGCLLASCAPGTRALRRREARKLASLCARRGPTINRWSLDARSGDYASPLAEWVDGDKHLMAARRPTWVPFQEREHERAWKDQRGWSLMIFCARATRGLGRPSLDARSGRSISPHPWRENEQAWREHVYRSMRAVKDSLAAPLEGDVGGMRRVGGWPVGLLCSCNARN